MPHGWYLQQQHGVSIEQGSEGGGWEREREERSRGREEQRRSICAPRKNKYCTHTHTHTHKFTESCAPPPTTKVTARAVTHENVLGVEDLVDAFMHASVHGCVG